MIKQVKDILKCKMGRATNYYEILDTVLNSCIESGNVRSRSAGTSKEQFSTYLKASPDGNDNAYIGTEAASAKLVEIVENHSSFYCEALIQQKTVMKGHVSPLSKLRLLG